MCITELLDYSAHLGARGDPSKSDCWNIRYESFRGTPNRTFQAHCNSGALRSICLFLWNPRTAPAEALKAEKCLTPTTPPLPSPSTSTHPISHCRALPLERRGLRPRHGSLLAPRPAMLTAHFSGRVECSVVMWGGRCRGRPKRRDGALPLATIHYQRYYYL